MEPSACSAFKKPLLKTSFKGIVGKPVKFQQQIPVNVTKHVRTAMEMCGLYATGTLIYQDTSYKVIPSNLVPQFLPATTGDDVVGMLILNGRGYQIHRTQQPVLPIESWQFTRNITYRGQEAVGILITNINKIYYICPSLTTLGLKDGEVTVLKERNMIVNGYLTFRNDVTSFNAPVIVSHLFQ